jgi:hypothetical protein
MPGPALYLLSRNHIQRGIVPPEQRNKPKGDILSSLFGNRGRRTPRTAKKTKTQAAPRGVMPLPMRGVPAFELRAMPANVRYLPGRPVRRWVPVDRIDPRYRGPPLELRPRYWAPQMRQVKPKRRTLGQRADSAGRLLFGDKWTKGV